MPPRPSKLVLSPPSSQAPLSKNQRAFNTLVRKLERARKTLAQWEQFMPEFQANCLQAQSPRLQAFNAVRKALLHKLDTAYGDARFNPTDRRRIREIVQDIGADILLAEDDAMVRALMQRYAPPERPAQHDSTDDLFGFDDLPPQPGADVDEEALFRQFQEAAASAAKEQIAHPARAPRQDTQQAQTVRSIYRKLASALHPDRETDAARKAHKTTLLQRANKAHAEQDLHTLLSLQLEIAMIDPAQLASMAEAQFKVFSAALKRQLREVEHKIKEIEFGIRNAFPELDDGAIHPQRIQRAFEASLLGLDEARQEIEDLLARADNPKALKAWMRRQEQWAEQEMELDAVAALEAFERMVMAELRPRKRRSR
ncbi:putative DnaJ-class molecular chaperone [Thiomonas sp. X19]|uniref:hypothetical protein n=1 Tax=Thiomonas sp. X19 TaxID=1050370 RepID=UPI000B6CC902|nr:hypothetical protein [Thiomonas sp. X19]SCC92992.1 putative DnaJ-class molecular chaperone [Thiomonas sp. X19]